MLRVVVNPRGPTEDDFQAVDVGDLEKVAFPSSNQPTFSAAFSPTAQVPPPQVSKFAQNRRPRSTRRIRKVSQMPPQRLSPGINRAPSERPYPQLHRPGSQSSVDSPGGNSQRTGNSKRWIIE